MEKERIVKEGRQIMENRLRIKKVVFKKHDGVVKPRRKIVLEKVEDDAILVKEYGWSTIEDTWYPTRSTAFFNGEETVETGYIITRAHKDVDRYFELLLKYEGYMYMEHNENNKDTGYEMDVVERSKVIINTNT